MHNPKREAVLLRAEWAIRAALRANPAWDRAELLKAVARALWPAFAAFYDKRGMFRLCVEALEIVQLDLQLDAESAERECQHG